MLMLAAVALRLATNPTRQPLWSVLPAAADIYFFVDLDALQSNPAVKWFMNNGSAIPGGLSKNTNIDNDTAEFERATGFRYQDHLHALTAARLNDNWTGVVRFRADRLKLEQYLESHAASTAQKDFTKVYTFGGASPLRMAILANDLLAFSIGSDATLLDRTMDRYRDGGGTNGDSPNSEQGLPPAALVDEAHRKLLARPLWAIGQADLIFPVAQSDGRGPPSLGGFLLGEDTLAGVEQILLSIDSGPFSLQVEGEILTREENIAEPLAEKLTLLSKLMRPRPPAAGSGERDYSPVWDAVAVSVKDSSVFIRWSPTPEMLTLLSGTKP
ncbi:MAG: hypothetical protein EXQ56_09160 [Acidobacteria bacterium]|nr:hypothetical protein [Acidobacteriota bacterium]